MIFSYGTASAQKDSVAIKKMLDEAYGFEVSAPQKALKIYRNTYNSSIKDKYWIGAFKALLYSGLVHNDRGNYDSAIYYFQKSKPFAVKASNQRGIGQVYVNSANSYQFKGDYETATKYYLKGIPVFEKLKDSNAVSQSYQNLTGLYANIKNYKLEEFYLKKAIQYSRSSDKEQLGLLYGDFGLFYARNDKFKEALSYFKKTEALSLQDSSKVLSFFSNRNLGEYYRLTKKSEIAIPYYEKALGLTVALNDAFQKSDLLYTLSGLYLNEKDYKKAFFYGQESLNLAKNINAREVVYRSQRRLSVILNALHQPQKAFTLLEQSYTLRDTVFDENHIKQISLMQTQFETEKKDKAIANQRAQLKKNEVELIKRKTTIACAIATAIALALLSLGIWLFFRQSQKLKNKEILALQQQQEITKLEALIDGEEKERRRIAQELHDGINGDLSAIKFRILGIDESNLSADDKENLTTTVEMIDQSCAQVRNISHNLMPASIIDFGLVETVQQYCSKISQSHPLELDFQYFGNPATLPKKSETVIYRIIQELINNIIKHSRATTALVQMNFHENELFITVEDNGVGFDVKNARNGLGLKNIESRIQLLKAGLEIDSSNKGTSFQINIDLNSIQK
ncbi:two-component sensor histidine kinase [Flavobacterium noncentrifugens]|nr:two-component sensor histidine kinase [Flavobacterium noncentrifugens]